MGARCPKSNDMDSENIITEKPMNDSNMDTNPIHDLGPFVEDVKPNSELMYIIVIIIQVNIYWDLLMQISCQCYSGPYVLREVWKRLNTYQMLHMYRWRFM